MFEDMNVLEFIDGSELQMRRSTFMTVCHYNTAEPAQPADNINTSSAKQ